MGKPFWSYAFHDLGFENKSTTDPFRTITVEGVGKAGEDVIKINLLELIQMIFKDEGRVYYAAGVCRNRNLHFATDRPTYFK